MMFSLAFITSFLITLSLAAPAARQSSLCPSNGVPDAKNFTLIAVSKTDTNIQKPLALGLDDRPTYVPLGWIGSAESMNSIMAKNFVMVQGGITAYGSDGSIAAVSSGVSKEHGLLSFVGTELMTPTQVYCELVPPNTSTNGSEFPDTLAVNGDSDHFSLCQRSNGNEFVIVYDAAESTSINAGYKFETCTDVDIHILPVDHQ